MTDDRSEFAAAREAGLRQRHEQRLARAATCQKFIHGSDGRDWFCVCGHSADAHGISPSKAGGECQHCARLDTKALVETATRLGRALGRKEAGEEMAAAFEAFFPDPHTETEACEDCMVVHEFAAIARNIAAREIATKGAAE